MKEEKECQERKKKNLRKGRRQSDCISLTVKRRFWLRYRFPLSSRWLKRVGRLSERYRQRNEASRVGRQSIRLASGRRTRISMDVVDFGGRDRCAPTSESVTMDSCQLAPFGFYVCIVSSRLSLSLSLSCSLWNCRWLSNLPSQSFTLAALLCHHPHWQVARRLTWPAFAFDNAMSCAALGLSSLCLISYPKWRQVCPVQIKRRKGIVCSCSPSRCLDTATRCCRSFEYPTRLPNSSFYLAFAGIPFVQCIW